MDLLSLEEKIGYSFEDKELLIVALTHKSFANEKNIKDYAKHNERLEFLGDAILDQIVSIYLYNTRPVMTEGIMSKKRSEVVCGKSLSYIVKSLDIQKYLMFGKCEKNTNIDEKTSLIADMFEALIGAIFLDSDFETVNRVCLKLIEPAILEAINSDTRDYDYKTRLQEMLQKSGNVNIKYVLDKEKGKEHERIFFSKVYFNNKFVGEGSGKSKKDSEQEAAKDALENINIKA